MLRLFVLFACLLQCGHTLWLYRWVDSANSGYCTQCFTAVSHAFSYINLTHIRYFCGIRNQVWLFRKYFARCTQSQKIFIACFISFPYIFLPLFGIRPTHTHTHAGHPIAVHSVDASVRQELLLYYQILA